MSINNQNNQIISYQILRMLIGIIGVALPLIVLVGQLIQGGWPNVSDSISGSYYSDFRDVLVGTLFVLGFFLLSYRGKDNKENWFANSGFIFSLGVALLPCNSKIPIVHILHYICAGALFAMFAVFSLWLFRRNFMNKDLSPHLRRINRVYIITGIILIVCILALALFVFIASEEIKEKYKPVFVIETIGLFSFAYSWFTRAHFLWRDPKEYSNRFFMFKP